MHGAKAIPLKVSLFAAIGAAVVTVAASRDARAQVVVVAPPLVVAPPPPAFVATFQPEYFEGRPVYWYHNNWYYRGEHGWSYYRTEPRYLHDRRSHWVDHPRVHYYRR
jgi:hypothetical protein